jgi:hypothetical protein
LQISLVVAGAIAGVVVRGAVAIDEGLDHDLVQTQTTLGLTVALEAGHIATTTGEQNTGHHQRENGFPPLA